MSRRVPVLAALLLSLALAAAAVGRQRRHGPRLGRRRGPPARLLPAARSHGHVRPLSPDNPAVVANKNGGTKMADDTFSENLLRALVAETHFLNCQFAAREMFGRGYFALGQGERAAVDQAVLSMVGGNYTAVTREWLAGQFQYFKVG